MIMDGWDEFFFFFFFLKIGFVCMNGIGGSCP